MFKENREPSAEKILADEYELKRREKEERRRQCAERHLELEEQMNEKKAKAEEKAKWMNIGKSKLERLVWSKPANQLS